MNKPRLAHIVLGGCEGCYVSLLDAHEGLVELLDSVEIVHSPLTASTSMKECEVLLVEGAVTTERDERLLRDARAKAQTLIAIGSCAVLGGIGGLRNLYPVRDLIAAVYGDGGGPDRNVPELTARVHPVSDIVEVDISVPGCAPQTETLLSAIHAALEGRDWDLPRRNMCEECKREKKAMLEHSVDFVSDAVYGLMELETIDPEKCFLEQGVICMGPMTREGCGARCTLAGMPCRGCQGPSRLAFEQGGKMIDALAAVLPAGAIMFLDDLIGTGYRYSMPVSVFPAVLDHEAGGSDE